MDRVLAALKKEGLMNPAAICALPIEELEQLIRPAGFYRSKAKSLKTVARYFSEHPVEGMSRWNRDRLRGELLDLRGVGDETADVILLYVAGKPAFVVDAYAKKLRECVGVQGSYSELQQIVEAGLSRDATLYQHYHALIVEHGKRYCGRKSCESCAAARLRQQRGTPGRVMSKP